MATKASPPSPLLLLCFLILFPLAQCGVTYDRKALIINGQRRILISGSIHYPRSTPEMWEGLIQKAKDGGLDVVETYIFWNGHEPSPGSYNFEGRYDLVRFIKTVHNAGFLGGYARFHRMMKSERLYESQGGPIIFSQIENEYGPESKAFGPLGHAYITWAAQMAAGLRTGVPWVMACLYYVGCTDGCWTGNRCSVGDVQGR